MTFKEFTGKNVEEAIRTAMREFGADLSDLDIEILAQGSRSILGVGGEEARILAAPKSAVAAAETVRVSEPMGDEPIVTRHGREPTGDGPMGDADGGEAAVESAEAVPFAIDEGGEQVAELARAEERERSPGGSSRGGRGRERARGPRSWSRATCRSGAARAPSGSTPARAARAP